MTIRCSENSDFGMVAVEADGDVRPAAADCVATHDLDAEIGEERDGLVNVAHRDSHVFQFDWHASHATEGVRGMPRAGFESS